MTGLQPFDKIMLVTHSAWHQICLVFRNWPAQPIAYIWWMKFTPPARFRPTFKPSELQRRIDRRQVLSLPLAAWLPPLRRSWVKFASQISLLKSSKGRQVMHATLNNAPKTLRVFRQRYNIAWHQEYYILQKQHQCPWACFWNNVAWRGAK